MKVGGANDMETYRRHALQRHVCNTSKAVDGVDGVGIMRPWEGDADGHVAEIVADPPLR